MEIYLLIEGQQQGPYTEEQVRQSLAEGLIPNDLPAWHEGLNDWVHVESLNGLRSTNSKKVSASDMRPEIHAVSQTQESPVPQEPPKNSKEKGFYRIIWAAMSFVPRMIIFGLSIGVGLAFALFLIDRSYIPEAKTDVFRVYEPAMEPGGAWYGFLDRKDSTTTDVIVDFGSGVTIANDDRIDGVFVPTDETGMWNDQHYRVYKVQGAFTFEHPAQ